MRVRWNELAKEQLRHTAQYIQKEFGQIARDDFMSKIRQADKLLGRNPYMGIKEPLLLNIPTEHRSIVATKHNKIVYKIIENHIEIIAFWDVRREPKELVEGLEKTE